MPNKFLNISEIKDVLNDLDVERVHLVGGEITTYPSLSEIIDYTKNELGAYTKVGHSNGLILPPNNIDAISISIKSLSDEFYRVFTGKSNKSILKNFKILNQRGIEVNTSSVYIPGYVEENEISRIAEFISKINPKTKYHISSYVPVPGFSQEQPSYKDLLSAKNAAREYLKNVNISWFSSYDDYKEKFKNPIEYQGIHVS
jgi:pyruvate-formate lyase-activating enzyme